MITINETDYNLTKILHESKLSTLTTRFKYRVYGLRQENNPAVLIEYDSDVINKKFKTNLKHLSIFFEKNGIDYQTYDDSDIRGVSIGLRRDVRSILNSAGQPVFPASLLCTIIYSLEDRVDIEQMSKYKIPSIPTLRKEVVSNVPIPHA